MSGYEDCWKLCARDIEVLDEIKDFVWTLKSRCKTGHQLMGVGVAISMIETILEGEMPQGFVGFAFEGIELDQEDAGEITLTLDVGDEDISMGGITFADFGSGRDHKSGVAAILTSEGGFDAHKAMTWLKRAIRVKVTQLDVSWDSVDE